MAHTHETHGHGDTVVEGSGFGAGMMIAAATLLLVAVLAVVLLVAQPWDDGGTDVTPNVPDVTDTNPGGTDGGTDGGATDGGSGGATDGGSGGGAEQPAQ